MCITAIALFLLDRWTAATIATMLTTFVLLALSANVAWLGIGYSLRALVSDERSMAVFNATMTVLLVVSIIPVRMRYQ